MTCEYTWPNHLLGSDRAAVSALLEQHGLQEDVAFGHSKVFIRSPRTLVTLEQSRARLIPIIVLLLQKVRPPRGVGAGRGRGLHPSAQAHPPVSQGPRLTPRRQPTTESDLSKTCGSGSSRLSPVATSCRPRRTQVP